MKGTQALGALLALCCLVSCIGTAFITSKIAARNYHWVKMTKKACCLFAEAWEVHVPTQEAFIGWRGETYLAPPASPPAAAAAEPLVAGSSADTSSVTTDTASVDQVRGACRYRHLVRKYSCEKSTVALPTPLKYQQLLYRHSRLLASSTLYHAAAQ